MIDVKEIEWCDIETGDENVIIELTPFNGDNLVWYRNINTGDTHCMSVDIFVSKHTSCGILKKENH